MIPSYIFVILMRIFWLMAAYSLTRLCFYLNNHEILHSLPSREIFMGFLYGLKFDLAAILFSNALLILLWMAPSRMQRKLWWQRFDLGLFLLVNLFFIGINVLDVEYYKFTGKRMSLDILKISGDLEQHAGNILASYWKLVVLWLVISLTVAWLCYRKPVQWKPEKSILKGIAIRIAVLVLLVIGMRGGVQLKPLHPMNAYFTTSAELGALTLNTPFNFLKSKRTFQIPETGFFNDNKVMIERVKALAEVGRPPLGNLQGWNVMVIIVESFATEYRKYSPFVNSLSQNGYDFNLNYANGRRSIEALPSILCGIPSLMYEPIVSSDFNNNELHCLAHQLGKTGYSTHFYHGAYNGSMYMDTFSKRAGFENFVGFNEFPEEKKVSANDKIWGILDEPMLDYAADQMDKAQKPFLLGVFTLSSHHPYYIPPELRAQFPDGSLEIHKSIGYADYSLKKFFERAEKSDWYNKTIFIITGDHIQKSDQPEYKSELGRYRVPLLVYVPGLDSKLPFNSARITQHIDIQPTVFDLLGILPDDRSLLGRSVFDDSPGYAYNFSGNAWWMVSKDFMWKIYQSKPDVEVFRQENGLKITPDALARPQMADAILDLQAIVQYTIDGISKNNLYRWKKAL